MKKNSFLFAIAWLATFNVTKAQLTGGRAFLKGKWLEAGIQLNGTFGTATTPPGYHPHPGSGLGAVYDVDHDGWANGSPVYMGDYMFGGSSFESWELQAESERNQALQTSGTGYIISGPSMFSTGSMTSVTDTGGKYIAMWTGTSLAGKLNLTMQATLDTGASWIVMKVKIYNVSSTTVPDLYYFRGCDPNNDYSWPGGSTTTDNWVTYQGDARHRVLVSARSTVNTKAYIGLGTVDSRAKAFHFSGLPISIITDLGAMYSETFPATYIAGLHDTADKGIGIVFKIGSLSTGDSAEISYSYIFSDTTGLDSAITIPATLTSDQTPALQSITICPNPATSEVFVTVNGFTCGDISVCNCLGQNVITKTINSNNTKITVQDLPSGIYFITLKSDNKILTQRLMKM